MIRFTLFCLQCLSFIIKKVVFFEEGELFLIEKYSVLLFIVSGSLILASGVLRWQNKNYACPTDPKEEKTNFKNFS